ncbi:phenol 2-monooxygenase [Nocardia africana]|uniref:propane 2-monooxygenase n=1 Tax=Nocardia africana TaxID=134964 RepID=A0A378WWY8_9NOCA|nr:phenol 2-monooxygenase [Nocardia africana]MCC3313785.1 phenol 2-monooxygenase [Nocardia africana]SUA44833.1 Phenol hydroxylase P1 protein [Nocardia africana]
MGYELRTQTIEPIRNTFRHLIDRFGDKPASRYQEATYALQPSENFHYRPTWDPEHELFDPNYSMLKLTDPYDYSDPRQYYYNTYVSARADHYEGFAKDLKYVEDRNLLTTLPDSWQRLVETIVLPLRHYEGGAQMISSNACRFAWGTTVSQPMGYAGMDRLGNAQLHSMIGLAMAGGRGDKLVAAKQHWLENPRLQPLRELVEHALIERDYAVSLMVVELVDAQLFPLLFRHCDARALGDGAMAYSLLAQHFLQWYDDQQKWLSALLRAWAADPQHGESNRVALKDIVDRWYPQARAAVRAIAEAIDADLGRADAVEAADTYAAELEATFDKLGLALDRNGVGA